MSRFQNGVIAMLVALSAFDGYDVLAIGYGAPGLAREWHLDKGVVGIVISMGLVGMAAGSLLLSPIADLLGRRVAILANLALMTVGMFFSAFAADVVDLCIGRVVTGIGIGAMIAAITPLAAEYSNMARRDLAIGITTAGYSIGGVVGGSAAALLLRSYDWRSLFILGGVASLAMLPLLIWRLPESIALLMSNRPRHALVRINKILALCGHPPVDSLPPPEPATRARFSELLGYPMASRILLLAVIYLAYMQTVYFILPWIPQIVADLGFSHSAASAVSVWSSLGGVAGGAVFGLCTTRLGLKPLALFTLGGTSVFVASFGWAPPNLVVLGALSFTAGSFVTGGSFAIYALVVRSFPAHVRATGTGIVISIGRCGAIMAPVFAGKMFAAGVALASVSMVMAGGALVAAAVLWIFRVPAPQD